MLPEAALTEMLEGPWDQATTGSMTGLLYFLKGDRMLELGYRTSSTAATAAVRLARAAVERL